MISNSFDRRTVLKLGALSILGSPQVLAKETGSEKRCVYILLQGAPSHIDLWDPKPNAPAEIRGVFQPIETKIPGCLFGSLLQNSARIADKLAVVRSMTHQFTNHIAGTYVMMTGSVVQPDADREAHAEDFPGPGAVLNYLRSGNIGQGNSKVPVSVSLPNWLSIPGPSNRMPGQYGGFLGSAYDPFLIQGEPQKKDFRPLNLTLPPEIPLERFQRRGDLLSVIDQTAREMEVAATRTHDRLYSVAQDLLTNPQVRDALDLSRESDQIRDRYGRSKIGQSLLLARRLLEAGVTLVAFNEFNQGWDHHGDIENNLKIKVPPMEQAFAALIEDLEERGMLDSTLVINSGEFGRTPVINPQRGRDHWPNAYTTVLAGGGIRGGQVVGSTDARGAEVASKPISPADLLATLWTSLGIDPHTELRDRTNRPIALTTGQLIEGMIVP